MAKRKHKGTSLKHNNIMAYGISELINKIEAANGNVDEAVKKAVDNSLELVGLKMQLFMIGHKRTGDTYNSYEQLPSTIKDGKVEAVVGYNIEKGGTPAIFLDVGTPRQKGTFYRYYALENSWSQLREIQKETLNKILEDLK